MTGTTGPGGGAQAVLKTLLVSDLVGSTALVERLGDQRAFAVFGAHDRVARDLLHDHAGLEIDKTDGFLLLFERPIDAVHYALAYHRALTALEVGDGVALAARVGIHLGEVFLRPNPPEDVARGAKPLEVEGLAKPIAARLMSAATGGQTLLTQGAFDLARRAEVGCRDGDAPLAWLAHGEYLLKGVDEPVPLFEVGEPGRAPLVPPPDSDKVRRVAGETVLGWRPAPGGEIPHRPHWRLERKLGEGGFGEVWLARHDKSDEPRVFKFCFERDRLRALQREVTLFRLLKEALGRRDDIARILDWNFDDAPYFVEGEFCAGGSLVDWAAAQPGGLAAVARDTRLELVAQVADALAAAHSVGVLHKDVKPGNILVAVDPAGRPRVRLTDFGIGMVTDLSRLSSHGVTALGFTGTALDGGAASGTFHYMAPELLEGRPATVQADVFALGVVCFQMAVGRLDRVMAPGWEREVGDEVLAADIAAMVDGAPERRSADAGELARRLRSLEQRRVALAEQRREQEEAAAALTALARARRRRTVVAVAAVVLAAFALTMTVQARRIARESARANHEAATASQVSDFLVSIFAVTDPEAGRGSQVTARELLDSAAAKVGQEEAGDPLTRARLLEAMGVSYLQLGLYDEAEGLLEEVLAIRRAALGEEHVEVAMSRAALGRLRTGQGRFADAEELLRQARARLEAEPAAGRHLGAVLADLAALYRAQGRHAEALPLADRAAELLAADGGEVSPRQPAAGGGASVSRELLSLRQQVALPADATGLLAAGPRPGTAVAIAPGGLYLVDLTARTAPALIPLTAGDVVVGWARGRGPLLARGGTVVVRELGSGAETTVVRGLPVAARLTADRHGRRLAVVAGGRLEVLDLGNGQRLASFALDQEVTGVVVSDEVVAWVGRDGVRARSLPDGAELLAARDWSGQAGPMALDPVGGRLAVGGWFDEVVVYDLASGEPPAIASLPGQCGSLLFLPDFPTLVIAKEGSLSLWRPGVGVVATFAEPGARFAVADFAAAGLLVSDERARHAHVFDYRGLQLVDDVAVSSASIWAMAEDGGRVVAGASDGRLHLFDPAARRLSSVVAHSQGVTSLVMRPGAVVTASDDKSIAAFASADLAELARTRAHDYLVNTLFWDPSDDGLWSASSDGLVKRWSWPGLEPGATIAAGGGAKAALWLDAKAGVGVVGTWSGQWHVLRRTDSWRVERTVDTPSAGVYSAAWLSGPRVVLLVGVNPTSLWCFDPASGDVHRLHDCDLELGWVTAIDADRALLAGDNVVAVASVERRAGALEIAAVAGVSSALGPVGVAAAFDGGARFALGTGDGRLLLVAASEVGGPRLRLRLLAGDRGHRPPVGMVGGSDETP